MAAVTPWGGGSASGAAPAGGGERGAVVPRSGCPSTEALKKAVMSSLLDSVHR